MIIRAMKNDDYDACFQLWNSISSIGMRSLDDSAEGIRTFLERNPHTSFIAEDSGIIGTILCGHDGRRGYIYHTAVAEGCREAGIGKKLVDAALEALKYEGINKVGLVVFADNDLGNGFWESIGFEKREDLFYRNKSLNTRNI